MSKSSFNLHLCLMMLNLRYLYPLRTWALACASHLHSFQPRSGRLFERRDGQQIYLRRPGQTLCCQIGRLDCLAFTWLCSMSRIETGRWMLSLRAISC